MGALRAVRTAFGLLAVNAALASPLAFGADAELVTLSQIGASGGVSRLHFDATSFQIETNAESKFATLKGRVAPSIKEFSINGAPVRLSKDSRFAHPVAYEKNVARIEMLMKDAKGVVIKESWLLSERTLKRSAFYPSIGYSKFNYSETGKRDFSGSGLTVKAAYRYQLSPGKWDVETNFYITALPFGGSIPNVSVRYLGVNARLGYVLPFSGQGWAYRLQAGAYFARMFVTGQSFGYGNLLYPQVYPSIRRALGSNGGVSAYFKFAPLGEGLGVSLSERELAGGLGYDRLISMSQTISFNVDLSSLAYNPAPGHRIHSRSVSLSVGLGL